MTPQAEAVFFDRDGVLVEPVPYLSHPSQLRLLPRAAHAVRLVNRAKKKAVLVTNQSAVGRGFCRLSDVDAVHRALERELARHEAYLDAIYLCPHAPSDNCDCRKPRGAMIRRAVLELGLNQSGCVMIGDKTSDVELAARLGFPGVLVDTGMRGEDGEYRVQAAHRASDALAAATWALAADATSPLQNKDTVGYPPRVVDHVSRHFAEYLREAHLLLTEIDHRHVVEICDLIEQGWRAGHQLFVCGNGGSAANASHFAEDVANLMVQPPVTKRLRATSLADPGPLILSVANDQGYEAIFEVQLRMHASANDILLCLSGSGNSPNVLRAARYAKENGIKLACLTGFDGGHLGPLANAHVNVRSENMGLLEGVHAMILDYVGKELRFRANGTPHAAR